MNMRKRYDLEGLADEKLRDNFNKAIEKLDPRYAKLEALYHSLKINAPTEEDKALLSIMEIGRAIYMDVEEKTRDRALQLESYFGRRQLYYDWDSEPILQWEYSFKWEFLNTHVAETAINDWRVSTVWLGINHTFYASQVPTIFETMIFKNDRKLADNEEFDLYQERYFTYEQAVAGHQVACEFVRERT